MLSWNEFFEAKEKLNKKNVEDLEDDLEVDDDDDEGAAEIVVKKSNNCDCNCNKDKKGKMLLFGKCKKCNKK